MELPVLQVGSETGGGTQNFGLVGLFPGEFGFFTAEVTVSGGLLVNGTAQVQVRDDLT